ncbi:transcriptional regulator [Loigolactobacillus backii]|uniref:TetR/AcrR family transcriptional regulator n=2 Tax=Loigolactobacillus backii TaxID=375175 RepID=UPI0007F1336A|nr:TetR/AcrR family transcriptional regulator [Loigolactobacillus backii]ANK58887.1 transcriptional regulator [Loigolactobacillus backii]ANK63876.1 transcriptional regulator [Loigolactobacillus backii]ANK66324.1 transcriptional regulator [Loigolactobacillus backii]OLF68381.1 transcriptional regulator [Loigolactobacillus backii]PIO88477.1 TetR family transcriptional regulator [Loigolactobacillus backii]
MVNYLEDVELQIFKETHVFENMTTKQMHILVAAIDIFADKGYANTSTKEIATQAGVAEGNIFSKFKNKRGLLNAIIAPIIDSIFPASMNDFIKTRLTKEYSTLHDFFDSIIKDRVAFLASNSKIIKIFVSEMLYDQTVRQQIIEKFSGAYWSNINQELNQLKAKHLIVELDNIEILKIMWSITGGIIIGHLYFGQSLSTDKIDHAIAALVKALSR